MSTPTKTKKSVSKIREEVQAIPDLAADAAKSAARADARTRLKESTPENVLAGIAQLANSMGSALADLGEQVRQAFRTKIDLDTAIQEQSDRLETLYDVEAVTADLQQAVANYDIRIADMNKKLADAETAHVQRTNLLDSEYGLQVAQIRDARKRDEDFYLYQLGQQRQVEKDRYEFEKIQRDRAEERQRADRTAALDQREAALKAREVELAELRVQVQNFPAELKKKVDAEVAIACNSVKKNMEHEAALQAAKYAQELALMTQAKNVAEAQFRLQGNEITRLNQECAELRAQTQTIAVEAVRSAGGRQALDAVQGVAKEMAAGGGKGGK